MNILYTRVSTRHQGFDSLENQKNICLTLLEKENIKVNKVIQEISSAFNGPQKKLKEIISKHKRCTIYVLNISRFSRNVEDALIMIKQAKKKRINIVFIEEELQTKYVQQHHIIRMKLSEAQHESEMISNRIRNRFSTLKKSGYAIGKPEFGKKAHFIGHKRMFIIDEKEENIIKFINTARYKTSVKQLNRILKKILPDENPIEFIDSDGVTKIKEFDKPKTLTYEEIAGLLNEYKIYKRGKYWTASSIASIINNDDNTNRLRKRRRV